MRFTIEHSLLCVGFAALLRHRQHREDMPRGGARSPQMLQRTHALLAAALQRGALKNSPNNS
jgi:hypothetical protein